MDKSESIVNIDGHELKLTNLDKVLWPDEGYTKGDLILYYYKIADYILPHLKNRPLILKRYPNGIREGRFFQKDVTSQVPGWFETKRIYSATTGEYINYAICNNKASLVFLANLTAISQNPWLSRWPTLDSPDFFTLDLDPVAEATFADVIEAAHLVKDELAKYGLKGWLKTSGATGLHVFAPIKEGYTYKQARGFAELVAASISKKHPSLATIEHMVAQRRARVYLDYLQNVETKTLTSVYSVRSKSKAPVSTPLEWKELTPDLKPQQFTMFNIFERLEKKGDLFLGVLKVKQDLGKAHCWGRS